MPPPSFLPARVRDPALALYAFCRVADDEVDFGDNKPAPPCSPCATGWSWPMPGGRANAPADRAMADLIQACHMPPRELPEALLEGPRLGRYGTALRQPVGPTRLFRARGLGRGRDDVAS